MMINIPIADITTLFSGDTETPAHAGTDTADVGADFLEIMLGDTSPPPEPAVDQGATPLVGKHTQDAPADSPIASLVTPNGFKNSLPPNWFATETAVPEIAAPDRQAVLVEPEQVALTRPNPIDAKLRTENPQASPQTPESTPLPIKADGPSVNRSTTVPPIAHNTDTTLPPFFNPDRGAEKPVEKGTVTVAEKSLPALSGDQTGPPKQVANQEPEQRKGTGTNSPPVPQIQPPIRPDIWATALYPTSESPQNPVATREIPSPTNQQTWGSTQESLAQPSVSVASAPVTSHTHIPAPEVPVKVPTTAPILSTPPTVSAAPQPESETPGDAQTYAVHSSRVPAKLAVALPQTTTAPPPKLTTPTAIETSPGAAESAFRLDTQKATHATEAPVDPPRGKKSAPTAINQAVVGQGNTAHPVQAATVPAATFAPLVTEVSKPIVQHQKQEQRQSAQPTHGISVSSTNTPQRAPDIASAPATPIHAPVEASLVSTTEFMSVEQIEVSNLPEMSLTESRSLEGTVARSEIAANRSEIARHVAQQIADIARQAPDRPVELALNPEELGRVRLTFTMSDGGIIVAVVAERGETMDLMRRHLETLAQEFRDIGYRDVNFELSQQNHGQPEGDEQAAEKSGHTDAASEESEPLDPVRLSLETPAGLDLRI